MHRVFLDANILFSAAYLPASGLNRLWRLPQTILLISPYAVEEARRNLDNDGQRRRLATLASKLEQVESWVHVELPKGVRLVDKDQPILLAAIAGRATHLLTGDHRHFGHLYGTSVSAVAVLRPAQYLASRRD